MQTSISLEFHDEASRWAARFLRETLERWREASQEQTGLFYPFLDRQWRRMEPRPLTLVSQCRLIYNFCRSYELFGDARAAEAAVQGLRALDTYFHRTPGLYRWAMHPDGTESDATPDSYGHAFCILAQATAARVFNDPELAAQARATWQCVAATFTDRHGGLIWRLDGPQAWDNNSRSQNPLMHMFEALMALCPVDTTGLAQDAAAGILGFVTTLSDFGAGLLVERSRPDWQPLPVDAGGTVDLGHAFEWAWLLSEWNALRPDAATLALGERFLQTGVAHGLDTDGGVFQSCDPQGRLVSRTKGLWPQCEATRALRRYAVHHKRTDLLPLLQRCLSFYRDHFVDAEYGGAFAAIDQAGLPADLHKGDAWKLDYHSVGMCLELIKAPD